MEMISRLNKYMLEMYQQPFNPGHWIYDHGSGLVRGIKMYGEQVFNEDFSDQITGNYHLKQL